jgi:hypothetical protein
VHIPRKLGIALAGLVGLGAFAVPAATAQALPPQPGQLQICTTEATPPGALRRADQPGGAAGVPEHLRRAGQPRLQQGRGPVPPPVAPIVGCYSDGYQAPPGYATTQIDNSADRGWFDNLSGNLIPGDTVVWTPLTGGPVDVCSSGGVPAGYVEVPGPARDDGGLCSYDPYGVPFSNGMITITPAVRPVRRGAPRAAPVRTGPTGDATRSAVHGDGPPGTAPRPGGRSHAGGARIGARSVRRVWTASAGRAAG